MRNRAYKWSFRPCMGKGGFNQGERTRRKKKRGSYHHIMAGPIGQPVGGNGFKFEEWRKTEKEIKRIIGGLARRDQSFFFRIVLRCQRYGLTSVGARTVVAITHITYTVIHRCCWLVFRETYIRPLFHCLISQTPSDSLSILSVVTQVAYDVLNSFVSSHRASVLKAALLLSGDNIDAEPAALLFRIPHYTSTTTTYAAAQQSASSTNYTTVIRRHPSRLTLILLNEQKRWDILLMKYKLKLTKTHTHYRKL